MSSLDFAEHSLRALCADAGYPQMMRELATARSAARTASARRTSHATQAGSWLDANDKESALKTQLLRETNDLRDRSGSCTLRGRTLGTLGEVTMADKQSEADKAQAMKEYREARDAAIQRIATLRAARLAREAAAPPTQTKGKKPVAK
jgi:hypothetical protein